MSHNEISELEDATSAVADEATGIEDEFFSEEQKLEEELEVEQEEKSLKPSSDAIEPNMYNIKPTLEDRFKAQAVKNIIHSVLVEQLSGKTYSTEAAKVWTTNIANIINNKVRDMKWKRYKHIVQVLIGEQRGAGVRSGLKCVWDSETDNYVSDVFTNETLFCLVVVFAIYFY